MPDNLRTYRTKSGRELTDDDIERLADEVANTDYDVAAIKRRRGRPSMGDGPADIVPVRFDPQLGAAVDDRVEREQSNRSEIIRQAFASTSRAEPPWPNDRSCSSSGASSWARLDHSPIMGAFEQRCSRR